MIAFTLGVEPLSGSTTERGDGTADDLNGSHGAVEQAVAGGGGDDPVEVSIEVTPVGDALSLGHVAGVAQGELREARAIGTLLESSSDRAQQEHRPDGEPLGSTISAAFPDHTAAGAGGNTRERQDVLNALAISLLVALGFIEDHRQRIST